MLYSIIIAIIAISFASISVTIAAKKKAAKKAKKAAKVFTATTARLLVNDKEKEMAAEEAARIQKQLETVLRVVRIHASRGEREMEMILDVDLELSLEKRGFKVEREHGNSYRIAW